MKQSKYTGGSKIVSFRLPIEALSVATIEIKTILSRYERESTKTNQNSVKLLSKQSKTRLTNRNTITYKCGCVKEQGIFKRHTECKENALKHYNTPS